MENKKLLWNREIYIYRKQLYFVFTLSYMARTSQTAKTLKNGRIYKMKSIFESKYCICNIGFFGLTLCFIFNFHVVKGDNEWE